MTDLFDYLLPQALICGVDAIQFWDYTLAEILAVVKSYNERQKMVVANNYNLAAMITQFIGCAMSGDSIPALSDISPAFANDDTTKQDKLIAKFQAEQWKIYAEQYNQMRQRQGGN